MTTNKNALTSLAERCEAATGPDRELDADIWGMTQGVPLKYLASWRANAPHAVNLEDAPAYTASFDAAMTLVPEGMYPMIDCEPNAIEVEVYTADNPIGAKGVSCRAATPTLALCAAALRTQASIKGDE